MLSGPRNGKPRLIARPHAPPIELLEGSFGEKAVMRDALRFEQTPVGLKADFPECRLPAGPAGKQVREQNCPPQKTQYLSFCVTHLLGTYRVAAEVSGFKRALTTDPL